MRVWNEREKGGGIGKWKGKREKKKKDEEDGEEIERIQTQMIYVRTFNIEEIMNYVNVYYLSRVVHVIYYY